MMRTSAVAGLLVLVAAGALAQTKPDFSGEWSLDKGRSRLGLRQAAAIERGSARIEHRDSLFRFHRSFAVGGQEDTLSWELTTDSVEVVRAEGEQRVASRLWWAGDTLVFLTRITAPRGEATNTVRYTLEDGGRTLRAEEQFRGPRLTYDNTWIFVKQ